MTETVNQNLPNLGLHAMKAAVFPSLLVFLLMGANSAFADFAGGDGSAANPWQIETAVQLDEIRNDLAAHYILTDDVDLAVATGDPSGALWNNGAGWEAIGTTLGNSFTGSLDGNGFKITGLFIDRAGQDQAGLFGWISFGATLNGLVLEAVNITGGTVVGVLVANNFGGTIESSYVSGSVNGDEFVGGLVGRNFSGSIQNSSYDGSVDGNDIVGALTGSNWATVTGSYSTATVSSDSDASTDGSSGETNGGSSDVTTVATTEDSTDSSTGESTGESSDNSTDVTTDESADGSIDGATTVTSVGTTRGNTDGFTGETGDNPTAENPDQTGDSSTDGTSTDTSDETNDVTSDGASDETGDGSTSETEDSSTDGASADTSNETRDGAADETGDGSTSETGDSSTDGTRTDTSNETNDGASDETGDRPTDETGDNSTAQNPDQTDDSSTDGTSTDTSDETINVTSDGASDETSGGASDETGDRPTDETGDNSTAENPDQTDDSSTDGTRTDTSNETNDGADDLSTVLDEIDSPNSRDGTIDDTSASANEGTADSTTDETTDGANKGIVDETEDSATETQTIASIPPGVDLTGALPTLIWTAGDGREVPDLSATILEWDGVALPLNILDSIWLPEKFAPSEARQDSSQSELSISMGDSLTTTVPYRVEKASPGAEMGAFINDDGDTVFVTSNELEVSAHPVLADSALFGSLLDNLGLALQYNEQASMRVLDADGPAESMDYLSVRADAVAVPSSSVEEEGLFLRTMPELQNAFLLFMAFSDENGTLMQQDLVSMPADWQALKSTLNSIEGVSNVRITPQGIISLLFGEQTIRAYMGYWVTRGTDSSVTPDEGVSLIPVGDVNGDGTIDIEAIYPGGDTQLMLILP